VAEAAWDTITDNKGGGASDPNILKLGDQNRIRLLEPSGRKWRQHSIDGEKFDGVDDNAFRSVVCPRGPDGNSSAVCPLDMKPSFIDGEGKVQQLFPVSIRYAANVWDYESGTVKVLLGGKQIFEEFAAAAKMGFDPTQSDFIIFKMGKDRQTSYKVIRGDSSPLPEEITPEKLHNLDKYESPDSADKIFEILADIGIDYDAIELPSFTYEEACAFVMPYTKKAKGLTMEQLYEQDKDFMQWLYGEKRGQGQYGDAVFQAMHAVLLHHGDTTPIEDIPKAPAKAAAKKAPTEPTNGSAPSTGTITLLDPSGAPTEVPEAAKAALLAAGFSEPVDEPTEEGMKTLVGPDGNAVTVPQGAVSAMLAAGFTDPTAAPEPEPEPEPVEPADDDLVKVDVSGTVLEMVYSSAKSLIAAGTGKLVQDAPAPTADPVKNAPRLPAPDEQVEVKLNAMPTPLKMPFQDARAIVKNDQGAFTDPEVAAAVAYDDIDDKAVAQEASTGAEAVDPPQAQAAAGDPLDKNLTEGPNDAGEFTHPALAGKTFKTKGAVTQALNRAKASGGAEASTSAPAPAAGSPAEPASGDKDALLEQAKNKLAKATAVMGDFNKLMELFDEVAGKRNVAEFNEAELGKLITKLDEINGE
jgi:hypothetical protein